MNFKSIVLSVCTLASITSPTFACRGMFGDDATRAILFEKVRNFLKTHGRFLFLNDAPEPLRKAMVKTLSSKIAPYLELPVKELNSQLMADGEKALFHLLCNENFIMKFLSALREKGQSKNLDLAEKDILCEELASGASTYLEKQMRALLLQSQQNGILTRDEMQAALACTSKWREKIHTFETANNPKSYPSTMLHCSILCLMLLLDEQVPFSDHAAIEANLLTDLLHSELNKLETKMRQEMQLIWNSLTNADNLE